MEATVYYPNFVPLTENSHTTPDPFISKPGIKYPEPNFIVSRTLNGEVLSRYSDDLWDFRPYRLSGNTGNARFNFSIFGDSTKRDVKWLMFIFLFIVDSGKATGISISTCMSYFKTIRSLANYCEDKGVLVGEALQKEELMIGFLGTVKSKNILRGLSSTLSHLISISSDISGYKVSSGLKFDVLRLYLNKLGDDNQHPIIPNRIYAELIRQLEDFISEFYDVKDRFYRFITAVLSCDRYGRSPSLQKKIGYAPKDFKPYFKEAAQEHGLWEYFSRYKVSNMPSLSSFIAQVQHGSRIMLHAFTGMRSAESLSLPTGSLSIINGVYKLTGTTSKFVGQKKETSWITSKEVSNAYDIVEMFAKLVAKVLNMNEKDIPLFVSTSYLSLGNSVIFDGVHLAMADASNKQNEIYNLLDSEAFAVTKEDLNELERISPFRAWECEKAFAVGSIWRFTIHQFRRSLAFYVAQSALVSLPSLKRQLKHISREMTVYYCQSSELSEEFNDTNHIAKLIKQEKPEADASAYISNVLNTEEKLYGAHGTFIERKKLKTEEGILFSSDRKTIIKQFKKGEIAYSETPLGACTTLSPCDKKLLRSITSCLTCSRAVIKVSRLDRVIMRQKMFVEELSVSSPSSIEYRTEKDELDTLLKFKEHIVSKEN